MVNSVSSRVTKSIVTLGTVSEAGLKNTRVNLSSELVFNLDHYHAKESSRLPSPKSLSYFADPKNMCWFLEPKLESEIKRLHDVVGNDGHFIIVGNGSSQLIQAALYALSPVDAPEPISVVSAAPYYSCYPEGSDFLLSGQHKWAGDARNFDKEVPYIEFVTSPNNPTGVMREPVVNRSQGKFQNVVDMLDQELGTYVKPGIDTTQEGKM